MHPTAILVLVNLLLAAALTAPAAAEDIVTRRMLIKDNANAAKQLALLLAVDPATIEAADGYTGATGTGVALHAFSLSTGNDVCLQVVDSACAVKGRAGDRLVCKSADKTGRVLIKPGKLRARFRGNIGFELDALVDQLPVTMVLRAGGATYCAECGSPDLAFVKKDGSDGRTVLVAPVCSSPSPCPTEPSTCVPPGSGATTTTTVSSLPATTTTSTTVPGPFCSTLHFVTGSPGGTCGRINDAVSGAGTDLIPVGGGAAVLECGNIYAGGGASTQPPLAIPDGTLTVFGISSCGSETAMPLEATTSFDTGSTRTCSAPGCTFGPPAPIPNTAVPATSVCVVTTVGGAVGGTLNAVTGAATVTLPLSTAVFVTGDLDAGKPGVQPCPECIAGSCTTGANSGAACATSTGFLTSHDCPPPGTSAAPFPLDLSPLVTAISTAAEGSGNFCGPGTGQRTLGALGTPARYIEVVGSPAGDLRGGAALPVTLASTFCVPTTGHVVLDTAADLPGPGAAAPIGTFQLVP
jgi:hypothetical protein